MIATVFQTSREEYINGAELDTPLALRRAEYSDSIGGGYYIPLANWRGAYDGRQSQEECYTRPWSTAANTEPVGDQPTGDPTARNPGI